MRVVVTRPESSGKKTAALLRERGHEPVMLPLAQPVHDLDAVGEVLKSHPALLAVTSAEAIRALGAGRVDVAAIRDIPIFAVGSATAKAATSFGFANIHTGDGDGRALAESIVNRIHKSDLAGRSLVYLAGRPRETGFEEALYHADIGVRAFEVYTMQPIEWQHADVESRLLQKPEAVLLYSRETARAFFALMAASKLLSALDDAKFICMSKKVLSAVPEAFLGSAFASPQPRETAMLELLDQIAGT